MAFKLRAYHAPDFAQKKFVDAPDCVIADVIQDGIAPDNFHVLSIYPEYFKIDGEWKLLEESRMDSVPTLRDGRLESVETRNLIKGDKVILGRTEDCEEGIYMHANGFEDVTASVDTFAFRTGRSRETSFSKDFDEIAELLEYEKDHGKVVWVLGPAFAFDPKARAALAALIDNDYADAVLAGNALATHDIEGAYLGTALGQDIHTQENVHNGHYNHLETLNQVRRSGSIPQFLKDHNITEGIMAATVRRNIPFVLTGSIRDDGPLPEVIHDAYEGQTKMREHVSSATTVIALATMFHSIATGNMTPSFRVMPDGTIRETYFYICDISEFVINKVADRGSLSSKGIVTNVQDFITNVADRLELDY